MPCFLFAMDFQQLGQNFQFYLKEVMLSFLTKLNIVFTNNSESFIAVSNMAAFSLARTS